MGLRVLVVDDEKSYCDLLSRVLEREGYSVTTAQDGETAVELLLGGKVDLLVTDLNMPELTGYDLLELARRLPRVPEILVITAQKSAHEQGGRLLRDAHCLLKPFSIADFRVKVGLITGKWPAGGDVKNEPHPLPS